LHSRGLDQVVITTAGSELARRLTNSGLRVIPVPWRAGLDPRVIPQILRQLHPRALLHAHDAHALTLAGLSGWLTGSPVIVTRRVIFPLRRRFLWKRARCIIAISTAVRDALIRDGLAPGQLVVIPSAVDPEAAASEGVDLRTRLGISETGQLVVTLGSLTPEKDHLTLISAAARLVQELPDLHWIIVGDGPLRQALKQQTRDSGVADRVHLLGAMDEPHRALAGADLFVLSSISEGLGSSLLAAMARGVPVVATRVGGIPDILGQGGGVMVKPSEPAELASAVRQVLGDANLRQQLTRRAHEELTRFSPATVAEQVLSVYRSCAHSIDGS
jgi:glycosyltransferase involved in cell wall biosynthesis